MEKLKFPIIKEGPSQTKALPGDDYLKFIIFYLKHIAPSSRGEKIDRPKPVDVPFRL